jgi:hypothetical protein
VSNTLTESIVEQAALASLESVGWRVRNGADVARSELRAQEAEHAIKETTV